MLQRIAQTPQHFGADTQALFVGLQRRIFQQIGSLQHLTQRDPLLVADFAARRANLPRGSRRARMLWSMDRS
jgi:hypothetical protein